MYVSILPLLSAIASSVPATASATETSAVTTLGVFELALANSCPSVDVRVAGSPTGDIVVVVPAGANIVGSGCRLEGLKPVTTPWPREDWRAVRWVTVPPDDATAVLERMSAAFDPSVRLQRPDEEQLHRARIKDRRWQEKVDACDLNDVARVVDSRGYSLLVARTGTEGTILPRCPSLQSTYVGAMESWTVDGWTPVSWMVYPGDNADYRELRDNEEAIVAEAAASFTP